MGQLFNELEPHGPLVRVREGMTVYDRAEKRVGTVKQVHFGDMDETARDTGVAPATAGRPPERHGSILEDLAAALDTRDGLPASARDRLLRVGYVAIDATGIFSGDRFATADQVVSVGDDRVILGVTEDELIGD